MKVLILSCDTGEGHNSAARAIIDVLTECGVEYAVADPLGFGGRRKIKLVAASYNNMIKKMPGAFGFVYKAGDLLSTAGLHSPVYLANSIYVHNLRAYILQESFDCVICTHVFAMETMTAVRRKGTCCVPCFGILTDYTCVPFFSETRMDGYFIPHEALRHTLTDKGVPDARVHSTGIPVRQRFCLPLDQVQARQTLQIPQDRPMLLIMSGGVGCGHVTELCDEVMKRPDDCVAYVLVGRNRELQEKLERRYCHTDRIRTVPFTDQVHAYMKSANVMITKPGGLTSTEAAVANVPLVHILAFSGCETQNVEFFAAHGMSVQAGSAEEAVTAAWDLIHRREMAERMRICQRENIHPDAAWRIAEIAGVVPMESRKTV